MNLMDTIMTFDEYESFLTLLSVEHNAAKKTSRTTKEIRRGTGTHTTRERFRRRDATSSTTSSTAPFAK